jgi:hypothetical protein
VIHSSNGRVEPRLQGFTAGGVIDAGVPDHDTSLALASRRRRLKVEGRGGGRRGEVDDLFRVREFAAAEQAALEPTSLLRLDRGIAISPRCASRSSLSVILLMIVGVAAFNIVLR